LCLSHHTHRCEFVALQDECKKLESKHVSDAEHKPCLQYKALRQASATVAHTRNATTCFSHSSSVGPWIKVLSITQLVIPHFSRPKVSNHITLTGGSTVEITG